jgi:biotin carboxylase
MNTQSEDAARPSNRIKIAVVHHHRSFFPLDLYSKVRDIADLIWVFSESRDAADGPPRLPARLGTVLDIHALDLDAAAELIRAHAPDGITTFVDDTLVLTAELALRLELPFHTPQTARTFVDKRLQRAAFDAAGIPGPGSWALSPGQTRGELEALSEQLPYPCVVKPAEGSGSRGIHFLNGPSDLLALLSGDELSEAYQLEEYLLDDKACPTWLGSYLSVESIVTEDRISHATLTGRFPLAEPFRETGNIVPAAVAVDLVPTLLKLVEDAARALDTRAAVIHTEIKLTPSGPKVIEINGRLGGRPPFVLGTVSSVNLFQTVCRLAAGQEAHINGPVTCDGVGFWLMIQPPMCATRVLEIAGKEDVLALPEVDDVELFVRPGDSVNWETGTDSRVAIVHGRSVSHGSLEATIAEVRRRLVLRYDRSPAPAAT